VIITVFKI